MQINRLFETVCILLNRGQVTAKELAEKFEVCERTIYRDIDALSSAGIPVYTSKGKGGGIRLLDNFVLDRTLFSDKEQNELLLSLQSMKVTEYPDIDTILSKLKAIFNKENTDWIEIDFSQWGSAHFQKELFTMIKEAILHKKSVYMHYQNSNGEKSTRTVDPLKLIFKDKFWYLDGFCKERKDYRTFKVTRITDFHITDTVFDPNDHPNTELRLIDDMQNCDWVNLKLSLSQDVAYRVYDEFSVEDIIECNDQRIIIQVRLPENEWLYGYILSFGDNIEVLEPLEFRNEIYKRLEKTVKIYTSK